jgi:hypothetical protein
MRIFQSALLLSGWLLAVLPGTFVLGDDGLVVRFQDPGMDYPMPGMYGPPMGMDPSGLQPWPGVEMYGPPIERTYSDQGIWFHEQQYNRRRYHFGLEYLRAFLRRPGTDTVGFNDPETPPWDPDNPGIFRPENVGVFGENLDTSGMRGRFEIMNEDNTGFETSIWFAGETEDHWSPVGASHVFSRFVDRAAIQNRRGVPLDDGAGGYVARYDLGYDLYYQSGAWGADADWYSSPVYEIGGVQIRTTLGAKFLRVAEYFKFVGADSALEYDIDPDTGFPDPDSFVDNGFEPYSTRVGSRTTSYLAGPQIGLKYTWGPDAFRVFGHTKFAVAANSEQAILQGDHLGDGQIVPFPIPTPANPNPTYFRSERTHTHVSPILDTAIFAEAPIFEHVPFVNDLRLFKNARLRVGYTFLLSGEMLRPSKIIEWRTPFADLNNNRSRWTMGAVSVGVDWRY